MESMRESSLVKKAPANIIWNFLGQGWLVILALIATPYIVHRLGTSLYGIYVLISVVIDYFAFLQLGMGAGGDQIHFPLSSEKRSGKGPRDLLDGDGQSFFPWTFGNGINYCPLGYLCLSVPTHHL